MVTCLQILAASSGASSDLVGACFQADATIQAARMQADAATTAGWFTLATGGFAIAAAIVAYLAAGRQVRLGERQHAEKQRVYGSLLRESIIHVRSQVEGMETYEFTRPEDITESDYLYKGADPFPLMLLLPAMIVDALSDRNWESHSILDAKAALAVIMVYRMGMNYELASSKYSDEFKRSIKSVKAGHSHTNLPYYEKELRAAIHSLRDAVDLAISALERYSLNS